MSEQDKTLPAMPKVFMVQMSPNPESSPGFLCDEQDVRAYGKACYDAGVEQGRREVEEAVGAGGVQPLRGAASKFAAPLPYHPEALAAFIRTIDGNHRMGAAALAEKIIEWLRAHHPESAAPQVAAAPAEPPFAVCDGKEQEAFEAWANRQHMDMDIHPLHYLFLDPETSAARSGWREAVAYCRKKLDDRAAHSAGAKP